MKINVIYILGISLLFLASSTHAFDPSDLKVNLTLAEPYKTDYLVGEPIKFDVEIQNLSDEPVTIIRPVEGMNYPVYEFNMKQPLDISNLSSSHMCHAKNYVQIKDFVTIPPRSSFQPDFINGLTYTPIVAGKHEISYVAKFNAEKEAYIGSHMYNHKWTPELSELVDKVPKVDIQSTTYTINVISNGATLDPSVHCLMGMPKSEVIRMYFDDLDAFEQSLESAEENWKVKNTVWISFSNGYNAFIYFDDDDIVDGVSFNNFYVSMHIDCKHIKLRSLEDLLVCIKGNNDEIPTDVNFIKGKVASIRVGYFAVLENKEGHKDED